MGRTVHPPPTVAEAKRRLREASSGIDYLAPIKRHPLEAAGAAFLAGLMWTRLGETLRPPSLLTVAVHLLKRL